MIDLKLTRVIHKGTKEKLNALCMYKSAEESDPIVECINSKNEVSTFYLCSLIFINAYNWGKNETTGNATGAD